VKKTTIAIILIVCLLAATAAWAINEYILQKPFRQDATAVNPSMLVYLGGDLLADNELLSWDEIIVGVEYYMDNLTVRNTGDCNIMVFLIQENFPSGWIQTWENTTASVNGTTLQPNTQVSGNLTLTANSVGTESWNSYVVAEQT